MLVVWAHALDDLIPACRDFEEKLIRLVWARRATLVPAPTSPSVSSTPGPVSILATSSAYPSAAPSASDIHLNEKTSGADVAVVPILKNESTSATTNAAAATAAAAASRAANSRNAPRSGGFSLGSLFGYFVSAKKDVAETHGADAEKGGSDVRPTRLLAPFYCGLACALSFCMFLFFGYWSWSMADCILV